MASRRLRFITSGDGKPFLWANPPPMSSGTCCRAAGVTGKRGMIDIAYHFAIDRTGRAWQLRWLQYEGQHVRNMLSNAPSNNEHNVGVVCLGDFNLQPPTVVQRDRLLSLVRSVRGMYTPGGGIAPAIFMHGELVSTDCPGNNCRR